MHQVRKLVEVDAAIAIPIRQHELLFQLPRASQVAICGTTAMIAMVTSSAIQ